jgi:putative hydrolase of the HAD superfamily
MTDLRAPRAVLFDLDDTLFAHRAAVEAGVLARASALGWSDATSPDTVARWFELEEHHYPRYLRGEVPFEEQRRVRAQEFAAAYGVTLDADAATRWFADYLGEYRNAWTLHDDALDCLDELARRIPGVRFGIITNGELDFQTTKLDAVQLSGRMSAVIASGDVGVAKPDPAIFALACERLGVEPADAAYVGDRLRTDAIGAASAGLTGVWLDRRAAPVSREEEAEATRLGVRRIVTLADLPSLLI